LSAIVPDDVRAALPPSGANRCRMLRGLKSIFGLLRARKAIFTNPAARILAEAPGAILPMPLNVNDMRRALNSTDPVQDLRCALSALHGLRSGQLRLLKLTDIDGARLIVGDRVIVFVAPVRERLTAYLNHRTARRLATANPCLFTHPRYANGTDPVGPRFVYARLGPHLNTRDLRTDRLLQEALAVGDAKRISEMFGLTIDTAQRYTGILGHPGLNDPVLHAPRSP
jgi:integrase